MNKAFRVGIIGAGAIARDVHIPNYLQVTNVEVIAIADIIKENAGKLANRFDIAYTFEDFHEMLDTVALDAVSICTPNKFHAEIAIAAMEAGCHVLCEKPPAMSPLEAEQMDFTSQKTGKILTYGFCYRYAPEVSTLKRFVDSGELGEIYAARVHALRRRGIPGWGVFTNKELQGGGALIDIGVHMLDTALHLMGYPEPDIIFGVTYQHLGSKKGVGILGDWDWKNFSVEDMARGMITFKNGASLILESAFAANIEKHEEMNVSLMGDNGGADVFPLKMYQEKHNTLIDITPSYLPNQNKFSVQIEQFVANCISETNDGSLAQDGLKLQQIINGLYDSAEKGMPIRI